ncbi:hypothetical protein AB0N05_08335 [Nocardia sp. NPDC051030]|uniref:hypothetical protein n=1 Tax=Nocardia sp. NPDC051030 TaxID=3155162 RepID=UPI003413ED58
MAYPGTYPTSYPVRAQPPQPDRPSGWWIVAGVLVILAGVTGATMSGVIGVSNMDDDIAHYQRVTVPGAGDLQLTADHDYTVYFENPSTTPDLPAVTLTLTAPSGKPVTLQTSRNTTYQQGTFDGQSEFKFHTTKAGTYSLTAEGGPDVTVAVGESLTPSLLKTVVLPLFLGFAGLFIGGAIAVTTLVRRVTAPSKSPGQLQSQSPGNGSLNKLLTRR